MLHLIEIELLSISPIIYIELRYFGMFTSLERYIPLFETYLLANDKPHFIHTRNDPVEKALLQLLTQPITSIQDFMDKMQKVSLNFNLQNQLLDYKLFSYIQSAEALNNDALFIDLKKKYSRGNFEYSRPAVLNSEGAKEGKEKSTASQIKLPASLDQYLDEKRNSNPQFIKSLTQHALSKVPESTLLNLSLQDKQYVLQKFSAIFHMDDRFLSKFLIEFQKEKRKTNDSYRLNNKILSLLTKKQLITLGESYKNHQAFNNEDYIDLWFNQLYAQTIRKHVEDSKTFTKSHHTNKRDAFKKIVDELESMSHYTVIKRYTNKLKSEILVLDTIVGEPNLQRLIDYLSTSQVGFQLNYIDRRFYEELRQNQRQLVVEPRMRYQLEVDKTSPTAFVEQYIELLFKCNSDTESIIEALSRFIDQKYLRKLSVKVRLYKGETIQNSHDYFSQQQLQSMKDRKEIKLHSTNSKKFSVEDDVVLDVSIKNIKRINIKVYQLNLEKHLLGETCNYNLNDQIELSFLIPTKQTIYENTTSNPFQIVDTQIDLTTLIPKAMGVYIVDFQGETVTSRAVIRKGTIICVDTFTEAGQQFSFFDQNGRPLRTDNGLKVWIRGQLTNLIDNKAFVPYSDETEYGIIVASVGDYAESFQKKFQEEKYKFDVGYIYNTESFIVGRKAKIILHGRLSMNNKSMDLMLLKDTKVIVTVTNNQNIKTTFPFQIKQWTNFEDQVIEFPIQAYTSHINVLVQSQINLQNKKDFKVNSSKDIAIDLGENSSNFIDFYLEQDSQKNYKLLLLGANGEPISNADVIISLDIEGVKEPYKKSVKTNSEGLINLGGLSIVKRVTAMIRNSESNIVRSWQIDQTQINFNYNNTIHFKLGHALTLPVNSKWKNGDVLLLRTFDKYCVEDLTSSLSIQNGILRLPVINEEGFYILKMLPIDKSIEIITLKNIKWEDDNIENQKVYDETDGTVYEINKNIYQSVAIDNITFNPQQDTIDANITLHLGDLPEDRLKQVRVHVLANNFIASDINDVFKADTFNVQGSLKEHYVQPKRSAYYSNKTFSEEGAYVYNRQSKNEQLIGNNLEKPSIFLKRIKVRETTQNKEEMQDQGRFIEECAIMDVDPNMRERFRARKASGAGSPESSRNAMNLNSHNNFLLLSGDLAKNLNGKSVNFSIPQGYNSIEVYVLTPKTALKKTYSVGSNRTLHKKDLRHTGLCQTEENFGWTMSREVNALKVNDKRIVSRNSQWRTVGLVDIFEFANNKKIKLYNWSAHLLNWSSYSQEKKREIYDKQCCHQLNTFIKFKDPKFFDEVVASFIRNKIEKNIVDYCLLNDQNYLGYTSLSKLNNLNAFEKALLVYTLTLNKQLAIAQSIVESMQLLQKSIKRNYEEYKNSFDTIINAKQQEQRPKRQQMKMQDGFFSGYATKMSKSRGRMMKQSAELRPQAMNLMMMDMREQTKAVKKAFVPVQSTKEYTQRTYYNVKDYRTQAPRLVLPSRFWAQVGRNFLNGNTELISETFMYLQSPIDFILASSFISSESSSNYELTNAGDNYEIHPKSSMLLYVKQVKKVDHAKKFGVLINQRFFDPNNRKAYEEDGTEYEREVQEFIVKKCYIAQTVVNNTSGTPLELQVLLDIPSGTIPLRSHEYTQIINISISPYSSQSFERHFYIPEEGEYVIYPSNASRGSTIIAKANKVPSITAKRVWSINKLESLEDILRSGDKEQVITFLEKRNIFDPNIFRPTEILWMLKEKDFYYKVVDILRKRSYFNTSIWQFAFLHLDLTTIKEFISQNSNQTTFNPVSFEYFPYYSSRTHQFANESKSTIRNVQFKETYLRFLIGSTVGLKQESFEVSYCYYLILQDRLRDANDIIKNLTQEQLKAHEIQFDYMRCFLDLSLNAPNFNIAREIIKKYVGYPIESWRKLFADVKNTIEAQDNDFAAELEKQNVQAFQTQVIQEGAQIKIIQPADTEIQIEIFQINLELYFSEYPFTQMKTFTSVKPSVVKTIKSSAETRENIILRSEFEQLKDATVEVTEFKTGLPPKKVSSFWWTNPEIKVKVEEAQGTLQVYLSKKRVAGAYVKVFSDKGFNKDFYRDGYTDMTGTFRYAMSDLDGIKEFSILVMTDKGGVIQKAKAPSKLGSF